MEKLKIVIGAYPDLFYRVGGLQVQVAQTYNELKKLGHEVYYIHEWIINKPEIDVYHQFSLDISLLRVFDENVKLAKIVIVSPIFQKNSSFKENFIKLLNKLTPFDIVLYKSIKRSLFKIDGFVFLGSNERNNLQNYYNFPVKHYCLIPNGIKLNPDVIPVNKKDYIVNIGSVNSRKNQLLLIKVVKQLNIPLKIIGPIDDPVYFEKCKQEAIGADIEFLGTLDNNSIEFKKLLAESRMLVLPSLTEVLPITVFEALSCGVPVVCTKNSSVIDYINTPFITYVSPESESQISKSILKYYLKNMVMPDEDVNEFIEKYTWENISIDLVKYYKKILNDNL